MIPLHENLYLIELYSLRIHGRNLINNGVCGMRFEYGYRVSQTCFLAYFLCLLQIYSEATIVGLTLLIMKTYNRLFLLFLTVQLIFLSVSCEKNNNGSTLTGNAEFSISLPVVPIAKSTPLLIPCQNQQL